MVKIMANEYSIYLESPEEWKTEIITFKRGDCIENEINMTPAKFRRWMKEFAEKHNIIVKYVRYDQYGFELEEGYSDGRPMPTIERWEITQDKEVRKIRVNGVWKTVR